MDEEESFRYVSKQKVIVSGHGHRVWYITPLTHITIQPASHSWGISEATRFSWAFFCGTLSWTALTWGIIPQYLLQT